MAFGRSVVVARPGSLVALHPHLFSVRGVRLRFTSCSAWEEQTRACPDMGIELVEAIGNTLLVLPSNDQALQGEAREILRFFAFITLHYTGHWEPRERHQRVKKSLIMYSG